jgi:hypothetical protein
MVLIPGQTAFEQLSATPQRKMRRVPGMHLQMKLAVPAVGEQPFFLGWQRAGRVQRHEILRQDDTSLQLSRPWIGAAGEIDHAAPRPVALPVSSDGTARVSDLGQGSCVPIGREQHPQAEGAIAIEPPHAQRVRPDRLECHIFIRRGFDVVTRVIQCALQRELS